MEYVIFTKQSAFGVNEIKEDHELFMDVEEFTNENMTKAIQEGFKFAHIFEQKEDDFDQISYNFVTSHIL